MATGDQDYQPAGHGPARNANTKVAGLLKDAKNMVEKQFDQN